MRVGKIIHKQLSVSAQVELDGERPFFLTKVSRDDGDADNDRIAAI